MPADGPHLSATKTAVEIPICAGELPGLGSRKDPSPESFGLVSRESKVRRPFSTHIKGKYHERACISAYTAMFVPQFQQN
uniref:Uncharacterized protein n=1 Tax=Chrysemys picta bellii TaxID=8478 RepID=A0A8C3HJD5_CHRPI